ncbi:ArfGap-domain-containing protein [Mycena venus]|uniref:ArfGap-domain-containing protein n=1 Tax=Mycena venus TaxID=2733690 RepID=A0A8H6Y5X3_9AGAR|nr:ArfGap-domain-containing protein [Mycena venus]
MAMDQTQAKKVLQELVKNDNRVCCDCGNPNPQWASLGFAVFLCLQCAGTHRGFGVHISFVRSISMDTWQPDQLKRMQIGGNAAFKQFMKSYSPAEQGGIGKSSMPRSPAKNGLSPHLRLRQHRLAPTLGLPYAAIQPRQPHSPKARRAVPPDLGADQKTANESYFASLGQANASRSADLPPSQGGRYQGFGNTPAPASPSQHPSYGLSSAAAPSFSDIQENPVAALSKGWSLFSAAVGGAARVVSENVIQPAAERVRDPTLQASVMGYVNEAGKRAAVVGGAANQWSKNAFGVDVAESVGGVVGTVKDRIGPSPAQSGYGAIGMDHNGESSGLYHDDDEDLFTEYQHGEHYDQPAASKATGDAGKPKSNSDWDDEWKDF